MFENKFHGKLGVSLGIENVGPLFYIKCSSCPKFHWKFGYYNGKQLCIDCLEKKLIEVGVLKRKKEEGIA